MLEAPRCKIRIASEQGMQIFEMLAASWLLASSGILANAIPVHDEAYAPVKMSEVRTKLLDFDDYPVLAPDKEYTLAEIKALMAEHATSDTQHESMNEVSVGTEGGAIPKLIKRASAQRKTRVEFDFDCPVLPARATRAFSWGAHYDREVGKIIYDPILHVDHFGPNREVFDNDHSPGTYRHEWSSVVCMLIEDQFCTYRFKGHFSGEFALDESWISMHFWLRGERPGRDPMVTETCVPASPHSNTCSAVLPMTHMCDIVRTRVTHIYQESSTYRR